MNISLSSAEHAVLTCTHTHTYTYIHTRGGESLIKRAIRARITIRHARTCIGHERRERESASSRVTVLDDHASLSPRRARAASGGAWQEVHFCARTIYTLSVYVCGVVWRIYVAGLVRQQLTAHACVCCV